MAEVKWIKLQTDIFDDEKILLIESLPDAYAIITVWFKLLCLAGKQNNDGVFMMSNRLAYTEKMLSTIFRMNEATVALALKTFEQFGMIEIVEGVITIPNWNKHQSLDAYEKKKERDRIYQAERRAKQRTLAAASGSSANGLPLKEWKAVLKEFNFQCAYCGSTEGLQQEHIIPVVRGGKYEIGNIIPACKHCNASKKDKEFEKWYMNSDVFDIERMQHIKKYIKSADSSADSSPYVAFSDIDIDKEEDKDIDNIDILSDSASSSPSPSPSKSKSIKHKYGEYNNVFLTDEELAKLKNEFTDWAERIERLSSYIASTGKVYKSHFVTIRNWAKRDAEKPQVQIKPTKFNNFSGRSAHEMTAKERMHFQKQMAILKPTAGTDEALQKRAEELKDKLGQ